jgi:hypothetical protein
MKESCLGPEVSNLLRRTQDWTVKVSRRDRKTDKPPLRRARDPSRESPSANRLRPRGSPGVVVGAAGTELEFYDDRTNPPGQ